MEIKSREMCGGIRNKINGIFETKYEKIFDQ